MPGYDVCEGADRGVASRCKFRSSSSFLYSPAHRLTCNDKQKQEEKAIEMKLPLGLVFALLLTLQCLQQATAASEDDAEDLISGSTYGSISGDHYSTSISEDSTVIPVTDNELDANDTDSVTSAPPPHIALNSSRELSVQTNETSTQKFNTSSPITPRPDPTPPMTNKTNLNNTVTPWPDTNSTKPESGSFSSNETAVDNQNSTTSNSVNSTTTHPPQVTNTTAESLPESPTNGTFPTTTTKLPTTVSTTTAVKTTKLNKTGVSFDVRGNSDRGAASDIKQNPKNQAWGAIVGVGVAVGFVALVVYVIMKRRSHRDFSHRKLVEEMPPEPVLRLDNGDPLDLKYDGRAYYNPGLQGDNIQMTSFPRGHSN
ncbi:hypothetical protein SRHO_G00305750 [Serrasalmus rhombeus]